MLGAGSKLSDDELHSLFGAAREGLGALRNLGELVQSVRVSPRSVAQVLPDVRAACPQMLEGIRKFVQLCPADMGMGPRELLDYVEPSLQQLARAMDYGGRSLPAAKRLELERLMRVRIPQLDAALDLLELLDIAATYVPAQVGMVELIGQCRAGDQPGGPGTRAIAIPVELPPEEIGVYANPRLTYGILGIVAAHLAADASASVALVLERRGDQAVVRMLRATRSPPPQSPTITLNLPVLLPPSLVCAEGCARRAGATLDVGSAEVSIRWVCLTSPVRP